MNSVLVLLDSLNDWKPYYETNDRIGLPET